MIRGTTPKLDFRIPMDVSNIKVLYVTFSQNEKIILDKELSDFSVSDSNILSLTLTQDDTLAFKHNLPVELQVRCRLRDGTALASKIIRTNVNKILKDGVI